MLWTYEIMRVLDSVYIDNRSDPVLEMSRVKNRMSTNKKATPWRIHSVARGGRGGQIPFHLLWSG